MFSSIVQRWQTITVREQYMIVLLGAIVLLLGIFKLHDATVISHQRLQEVSARAASAGDGINEDLWSTRSEEAQNILDSWRKATWQSNSYGIIQAQMQTRLLEIAAEAGLTGIKIDVDPSPVALGTTSLLRFRVNANARFRSSMPQFLAGLVANEQRLILDEASILAGNGAGRLVVSGMAPVLITSSSPSEINQ